MPRRELQWAGENPSKATLDKPYEAEPDSAKFLETDVSHPDIN
jgi:hypothetical protein